MNKQNSILLVLLFVAVQVFAGPVSKEEAMLKAKAFMADKGMKVATVNLARKAPSKSPSASGSTDNAAYYVFNAEQDGFVIISGDDRTVPVLGYSDSGSFSEENMPDNLKAWLEGYADQIAALDAGAQPARVPSVGTAISKMLTTTWDQGEPYNNSCPEYFEVDFCATGCTATATAQIMNYHKSPTTASAIPGYTTDTDEISVDALEATTFDWANMLDSYSGTYTNEQATAVAELMRYVGQAMEMDYGLESGSTTTNAIKGLVTYFGYDQNITCEPRANYTIQAWHDMIYNELKEGRPVLYGGQSSGGGHSFVIDGYDGTSLFHVNWGWGGYCDGYFSLEVLNPSGGGTGASSTEGGYSYEQDCAIGLQPSTGADADPEYLTAVQMVVEGKTLSVVFCNFTKDATEFDCGFGIVDSEGNISSVLKSESVSGFPMNNGFEISFDFTDHSIANGSTIKVVPVSRETTDDNSNEWKSALQPHQYALFTGGEDNLLSTIQIFPEENVEFKGITVPENIYEKIPCNFVIEVENLADECNGVLRMIAVNKYDSEESITESEGLYLEKDAIGKVTLSPTFEIAGEYSYTIEYLNANDDENTCITLHSGELTVEEGYLGGTFNITESGNVASVVLNFVNGSDFDFAGNVEFAERTRSVEGDEMTESIIGYAPIQELSSGSSTMIGIGNRTLEEGCEYQWVATFLNEDDIYDTITSRVISVPITVSVTDAGYSTYCPVNRSLDFSDATDIQAYKATVSGTRVVLTKVDVVNKGVGVILCSDGAASEAIPFITDGTTDETPNLLVGLSADETIYETATIGGESYNNYVLDDKDGKIAFYKAATAGTAMEAGMAYLRVPSTISASFFSLDGDDGATGISEAVSTAADNAFYTLQGIRVDAPTKGLYIHRGRIVVVK